MATRPAINQEGAKAAFRLGTAYYQGEGVPWDLSQALQLWRKAANQGYAPAQTVLGNAYHYGSGAGLPKDETQAIEWWRKAADQGYAPAQALLDVAQKRDAIVQLLDMTQSDVVATQIQDAVLRQMKAMYPDVPEAVWQEMAREFTVEEFREVVIPIYAQHLSLEDIHALIAFYSTPAGQRMIRELPAVAQESVATGQQWGQAKVHEIVQRLQEQGYQRDLKSLMPSPPQPPTSRVIAETLRMGGDNN